MYRHELNEIISIIVFISFGKKRCILKIKREYSFCRIRSSGIKEKVLINFDRESVSVIDLNTVHINRLCSVRLIEFFRFG